MTDFHRTTITFLTLEPVTPDHLARCILEEAGAGALRAGEGCELPSDPTRHLLIEARSYEIKEILPDFMTEDEPNA